MLQDRNGSIDAVSLGSVQAKGRSQPVEIYEVASMTEPAECG